MRTEGQKPTWPSGVSSLSKVPANDVAEVTMPLQPIPDLILMGSGLSMANHTPSPNDGGMSTLDSSVPHTYHIDYV